jgi:2-dehydro-3-deoxyphosphogluconate aldolase / (4S)-4-hydroxy-2-oxoglutarate aldolase
MTTDVLTAIRRSRVVAIVRQQTDDLDGVVATAEAVVRGGLPVVEVTLNTPGALEAITQLARRDDAVVGAGTVLTVDEVDAAADAGASFVVSPDVDVAVIARAAARGLVTLPGACTPTEIRRAVTAGADLVKLFPAGPIGGPAYVGAVRGPFRDVGLVPTGGIGLGDVEGYLVAGAVAVGLSAALVAGSPAEVAARAAWLAERVSVA